MVAAEICLLSNEQTFLDRLSALNLLFVSFDPDSGGITSFPSSIAFKR